MRAVKHKNTTIMVHSLSPAMPQAQQGLHSKARQVVVVSCPDRTAVQFARGDVTWDMFDLFRCTTERRSGMFNALLDTMLPNSMYWSSMSGVVGQFSVPAIRAPLPAA